MPLIPPAKGNPAHYLPKFYEKPCTWEQRFNFELSFETQSFLQNFLEALNLFFASISNKKDMKIMKYWNIYDINYIQVKVPYVVAWYIFTLEVFPAH